MQLTSGSKRSRPQSDGKENDATVTSDTTRSDGERSAQRLRLEGETREATQPAVAREPAAPSAAAAASALSGHAHLTNASRSTARADSRCHAAGGAVTAVSQQVNQTDRAEPLAVAAASRPLISPAQRCDPDSLSLVLSFLGTADFLAAIRVCRQWNSARMKHTAWPQLHLPTFIQSLRDDDYGNPDRRRLNVAIRPSNPSRLAALLGPRIPMAAAAGSAAPCAGSMWRHVTDAKLRLRDDTSCHKQQKKTAWESNLQKLAQLPFLSVLNLQGCTAGDEAVVAFCSAVAARLQALILSGGSAVLPIKLPLLSNLRVLVLNQTPVAAGLLSLHQLEYLHFHTQRGEWNQQVSFVLTKALRWLSSERSLVSLSVDGPSGNAALWELLFSEPEAEVHPAAAAAAGLPLSASSMSITIDWAKPCGLTDVSMTDSLSEPLLTSICELPQLIRLQCESHSVWHGRLLPLYTLSQLQQLRLKWRGNPSGEGGASMQLGWSHLQQCSQLRVLDLSCACMRGRNLMVPVFELQHVLAACTATLEELRLNSPIRIEYGAVESAAVSAGSSSSSTTAAATAEQVAVPNGWGVLAQCTQLRVMEMTLQPDTAKSGMLEALSLLPAFQSLGLTVPLDMRRRWSAKGCKLPKALLRCIVRSHSWCSLYLHSLADSHLVSLLDLGGGLAAQMPVAAANEATASRLRVYDHKAGSAKVLTYAIRTDERGVKAWQQG